MDIIKKKIITLCKKKFLNFNIDFKGKSLSLILKDKKNYHFANDELKKILYLSKILDQDIRLCLHSNFLSTLQSMIIVNRKSSILFPHYHKNMDEVFSIIYGSCYFYKFDKKGKIVEKLQMSSKSNSIKYVPSSHIHLIIPRSPFLVFHETHKGPFSRYNRNFYLPAWFKKMTSKKQLIFLKNLI
ncbi:WbuC family cupin fold metalloprotein [Candidatus Pelagibacter sp.]|nr:WbuC family cupin fold metalloprotein [Candidatus Pelagibacter sp.]